MIKRQLVLNHLCEVLCEPYNHTPKRLSYSPVNISGALAFASTLCIRVLAALPSEELLSAPAAEVKVH